MTRQGVRARPREWGAGEVVAVTPSGLLTVRAPGARFFPEGTAVADQTGAHTGRVVKVFGPVARPYLSVRLRRTPRPDEASALLGTSVVARGA